MNRYVNTEYLESIGFSFHTANNLLSRSKQFGIRGRDITGFSRDNKYICPRREMLLSDIYSHYKNLIDKYSEVGNMKQFIPRWKKAIKLIEGVL